MSPITKTVPRFLPTLTEVVRPPMPEPPSEQAFPQTPAQLPEQRAEHVRLQAQAALESRLQPLVDALLQEQGQWLLSQLKRELAPMVQQAVAEAMAVQQKQTVF